MGHTLNPKLSRRGINIRDYMAEVKAPWGYRSKLAPRGVAPEGAVAGQYMERDFLVSSWGKRRGTLRDAMVRLASGKNVTLVTPRAL